MTYEQLLAEAHCLWIQTKACYTQTFIAFRDAFLVDNLHRCIH
jgi:hypothetical protein